MKKTYGIFLSGTTVGGAQSEEVIFNYELRKLLPRTKRFIVRSSFDTANFGVGVYSGIEVAVNLPADSYNVSFPTTKYVKLGTAKAWYCAQVGGGNAQFTYSYNESECYTAIIDNAEIYPVVVQLTSVSAVNLPVATFTLRLTFEELDE